MKPNTNIINYALIILFLGISMTSAANENVYTVQFGGPVIDSNTVSIELLQAKKGSIRLYSNTSKDGISFSNSFGDQPLEFFIFALDGTLVHQTILNPKEKKTITTLKKGIYLYDLFYKDESIERGKITIQ